MLPIQFVNFRIPKRNKMSKLLKKRYLDFITPKDYSKLSDEMRENLLKYRRIYNLNIRKQSKIQTLENQLKSEKEKMKDLKSDLSYFNTFIETLRKDYDFQVHIIKLKGRMKKDKTRGMESYNLCVSNFNQDTPKNISLGNYETFKKHLLEFYKRKPKIKSEVNKDWVGWLKYDSMMGETRERIKDMILSQKHGFQGFKETPFNRNDIFPIK